MNVVDSSGWLEYFSDGSNASYFAEPLSDSDQLVVPSISVFEVFKVLLREKGESAALQGAAAMQRSRIVDLTGTLAMSAATLSLNLKLPMADSMILAVANSYNAVLWTQDVDFKGMENVNYIAKAY